MTKYQILFPLTVFVGNIVIVVTKTYKIYYLQKVKGEFFYMSLKKRIIQASTGLAVAGALTLYNTQEAEASSWIPNTVEDIKDVIDEQAEEQDGTIKYEFQWGDTLWAISEATDISLNQLTQINDIQNADLIRVGGSIYLSNDGSVVSVEEDESVRSYDVSEETVVETETPEEVTEQSNEAQQEAQSTSQESSQESSQSEPQESQAEETQVEESTQAASSTESAPEVQQTSSAPAATGGVYSIAAGQQGAPYVWGGSTPGGFDCSGFVNWVFAQAGRSVPRTTGGLYSAATPVSSPQVGDLVFFGSGSVTHVGIYAGNGQFIGAQTSTGVAHASVHSGYWGARFIGYGRI